MRRASAVLAWTTATASHGGNGWGTVNSNNANNNSNNSGTFARGSSNFAMTEFASKAAALKRRHRGKGQYDFARREAEKFLEEEVPRSTINQWIEKGNNALALAQLLSFFEIQPDTSLQSLITNKLVRIMEDTNYDSNTRLLAAIALTQRGEQYLERTFAAVEVVLCEAGLNNSSSKDNSQAWGVIELAAKVLQRGGKHTPSVLGETLAHVAMVQLQRTPTTEMASFQPSLLRVYGWLARIGKVTEASHFLIALVDHTGNFHSYDFSTLFNSCLRHHQESPLPLKLLHRMACAGLMYSTSANGRDVASIVVSMAKILNSLEPGKDGVTQRDMGELGGRLNVLLEEYEPRVLRFFDPNDKLHWAHCDDMTSIVFAYEMGGRIRYRDVFVAYQMYVAQHVTRFEPQQLAIASGILRRSHLLSPELAVKLGERIETVLGEFSLSEISHICATFAPMSPTWMPEAKALASRLLTPECSSYTRLTLALAFPDEDIFYTQINYKEISTRQLVDAISLAKGTKLEQLVIGEIIMRLNSGHNCFSPDDIRMLQVSGRQDLEAACGTYLSSRFAELEWTSDTLYCLPLASGMPHARDPVKALAAAKTMSISPEQFVSLVELITCVFGTDSDEAIAKFVVSGGEELISAERVQLRTVVRYLEAVRPLKMMHPNAEWIAHFNERFSRLIRGMKIKDIKGLLWSLHAVYGNVMQQPLLQQTLTAIVSGPYAQLTQPDEDAAQLTVLIAQLQHGMSQPLLTESAPEIVASVRNNAASYRHDLKMAVMNMSLQETETKRKGRFTIKAVRGAEPAVSPVRLQSQDVNDELNADPFAAPSTPNFSSENAADSTGPGYSFFTSSLPPTTTESVEVATSQGAGNVPSGVTPDSSTSAAFVKFSVEELQQEHHHFARDPHEGDTTAAQSAPKQWSMRGDPQGVGLERGSHHTSITPTPPATSPGNINAAEPRAGSSYMKLFSPSQLFSSGWPKPLQEEKILADDTTSKNMYGRKDDVGVMVAEKEQQQPRRTSLPRVHTHTSPIGSTVTTATTPSFDQGSHKFGSNSWSNPSGIHAKSNMPWVSTSVMLNGSASQPSLNGAERGGFWSSPHMHSPTGFFGGGASSNGNTGGDSGTANSATNANPTASSANYSGAGVNGAFGASTQHAQYAQPPTSHMMQSASLPSRMTTSVGVAAPGNHLFFDPAAGARPRPVITKKSPPKSAPAPSMGGGMNQAYAKNAYDANDGASRLMKKMPPARTNGQNTDSASKGAGIGDTKGPAGDVIVNKKVVRSFKKHKSLSEWLNAPSRHEASATRKGRVSPPVAPPVNGKTKEKGKRGKDNDAVTAAMAGGTKGADASRVKTANQRASVSRAAKGNAAPKAAVSRTKKLDNINNNINNKGAKKKANNEKKPSPKQPQLVAAVLKKRAAKKPAKKAKAGKRK